MNKREIGRGSNTHIGSLMNFDILLLLFSLGIGKRWLVVIRTYRIDVDVEVDSEKNEGGEGRREICFHAKNQQERWGGKELFSISSDAKCIVVVVCSSEKIECVLAGGNLFERSKRKKNRHLYCWRRAKGHSILWWRRWSFFSSAQISCHESLSRRVILVDFSI